MNKIEKELLELINAHRQKIRMPRLIFHRCIYKECLNHVNSISNGIEAFSHDGFDKRIKKITNSIQILSASEILGCGQKTAEQIFDNWMDSTKHRAHIEGDYNLSAVASAPFFEGGFIFNQIFVKSDPASIHQEHPLEPESPENKIFNLVNLHRMGRKLEILSCEPLLNTIATAHAELMLQQDQLSHQGFNERAQEISSSFQASAVGENIASGTENAQEILKSWLNSESHRKNIEGNFNKTGIGIAKKDSQAYYCQIFVLDNI